MSSMRNLKPIRVGLLADEPIRRAGLVSIFEDQGAAGQAPLQATICSLDEVLLGAQVEYLIVDLNSATVGLETLEAIRRARPGILLIVIGPEGNDELVMESIIAGARGYLDSAAGPQAVRQAIEVVTSGSIWAPRRLLSKLIDRLLKGPDTSLTNSRPHLTEREQQVLECIMRACSNREIARQLGIEERTVKAHVGRLMRKTGTENRTELSMRAMALPIKPVPVTMERRRIDRSKAGQERACD